MEKVILLQININDIVIPEVFKNSRPSSYKLEECRGNYMNGILDRDLVVVDGNRLVDGYILYLVMKEHNYNGMVEVKKSHGIVMGRHPGNPKNYYWNIDEDLYDVAKNNLGGMAIAETSKGDNPIKILKVFRSNKFDDMPLKFIKSVEGSKCW